MSIWSFEYKSHYGNRKRKVKDSVISDHENKLFSNFRKMLSYESRFVIISNPNIN